MNIHRLTLHLIQVHFCNAHTGEVGDKRLR